MKKVRVSVDLNAPRKKVRGRINQKLIDATTEINIARHKKVMMPWQCVMLENMRHALERKWACPS